MKKIIVTILAIFVAGITSLYAEELTGTVVVDGQPVPATYIKLSDNSVALGNGHNACVAHYVSGFLSVPGTVDIDGHTYTVTEVSSLAFRLCDGLTGVEFKEGVTRVGTFAFSGCRNVTEITLPESMQSLGSGAFQSCLPSLKSVTCKGATPPRWEYNDVFAFHSKGISDNAAEIIPATVRLYVPDEDTYLNANYTNPSIGWTTADGWGSFTYIHIGQATYHIATPLDLHLLREIASVGHMYAQIGVVSLDADIDMSAYPWDDGGIGMNEVESFDAEFRGNGHTISNLTVTSNGYGGFFSHYGGHRIQDVTFKNCTFKSTKAAAEQYPDGVMGGVVGECGKVTLMNVCLDNCYVESYFGTNGMLVGRCLTSDGVDFINCVVKNSRCCYHTAPSYNGDLVGMCYGGTATDCAIFDTEVDEMLGWYPYPFVGKCDENTNFYVTRSYNTRSSHGYNPATERPYWCYEYAPADNVVYSQVVLENNRNVNYIDEQGNPATKNYAMSASLSEKSAYFKSLFMVAELGLEHWAYQDGEFPVPATMEHLLPQPQVNRATYRPAGMKTSRVNGLSPDGAIPSEAWSDLSDNTGFRSYSYKTSRLWIDDDFTTDNPSSMHNPMLPIGSARITSTGGITFDRVLGVTKNGTAEVSVPNAVLDDQGNPMKDENGDYITDGRTKLYDYDLYKATGYTLYLPYEINLNGHGGIYRPTGMRRNGGSVTMEIQRVKDGVVRPWIPYYVSVLDAPVKLGVDYEIVLEPRDFGLYYDTFDSGNFRIYGNPCKFTPGSDITAYQLQDDNTWIAPSQSMPPFTCYITNESGEALDRFAVAVELPLADDGDNEEIIASYEGNVVDVVLEGRTFYKDDTWYTLCLPFDLNNFSGTPLEGASVRRLLGSQFNEEDASLKLSFAPCGSIEAGKPYLVKWPAAPRVENPVFEAVTIKNESAQVVKNGPVRFIATFSPLKLPASDKLLYMGDDNQLLYPEEPLQMNAFRGFFMLDGSVVGKSSAIRRIVLDVSDVPTAVEELPAERVPDNHWYSIDGRLLRGKPTAAGVYIHAGKVVFIK